MTRESLPLEVLVHIRDIGDRGYREREWAGTKGESRRLEGFQIRILPPHRIWTCGTRPTWEG